MRRRLDNLIEAYGALSLVLIAVTAADIERIIHLSDPIRQALGTYFRACIAIGIFGAGALSVQRVIDLRRRQVWEKLSTDLDSADETPVNRCAA